MVLKKLKPNVQFIMPTENNLDYIILKFGINYLSFYKSKIEIAKICWFTANKILYTERLSGFWFLNDCGKLL